ncbi:MAG TPA: DNA cytosine methyltransferase [Candidatus Saccharimonadales bacterium]|nr:DNA cytosine methyltransferase [Candidatus Saccharimonadales bacterium]
MKVLDLFAGAGGFGLGFKLAGHTLLGSIELDKWACETLCHNAGPGESVIQADLTQLKVESLHSLGGDVDVLIGGPPCQGFSVAGPQHKDSSDPRNSLFREFIRVASYLAPKMTVIENVPGLLKRKTANGRPVISVIMAALAAIGYEVHWTLLRAQDFGVPQIRERLFIFGFRPELLAARPWASPRATHGEPTFFADLHPFVTLWEAIGDLPKPGLDDSPIEYLPCMSEYQSRLRQGSRGASNHVSMKHTARLIERFKQIACGESQSDVYSDDLRPRKRFAHSTGQTYDQNNRRMHPDRPCHTLPASFYANFLHPYEHRNFTAREGARIQGFPDTYIFKGLRTTPSHSLLRRENRLDEIGLCQYNQIGNAVSPLLAKIIAQHLEQWDAIPLNRGIQLHGDWQEGSQSSGR